MECKNNHLKKVPYLLYRLYSPNNTIVSLWSFPHLVTVDLSVWTLDWFCWPWAGPVDLCTESQHSLEYSLVGHLQWTVLALVDLANYLYHNTQQMTCFTQILLKLYCDGWPLKIFSPSTFVQVSKIVFIVCWGRSLALIPGGGSGSVNREKSGENSTGMTWPPNHHQRLRPCLFIMEYNSPICRPAN